MGPNGTLAALRRLQSEGLVGAIGTAVGNADFAAMAAESGEFDIIGSYHHYTLLNQDAARRIHPQARRHNLGVINISPFGGNILGTGAVQGARYSYREAAPEVLNEVRHMEQRAQAHGMSLPTAALAYSLACPDIDVNVIGPTSSRSCTPTSRHCGWPRTLGAFGTSCRRWSSERLVLGPTS